MKFSLIKRLVVWAVVLAALGAGGYYGWQYYRGRSQSGVMTFRTAEAKRGDVIAGISATGTVVPEDVIDIGAQVNGQIESFGVDEAGKPVDYRSSVKEGGLLARIDDTLYAADVSASEAQLAQAQAAVRVAEANKNQAQARLDQAERDWARAQKLGESKALSQADYDASKSNYEQSTANLAVTDAQIGQAKAQIAIAQASLQRAKRNLFYCVINSPVNGVIIDRRVEIGQTVVSSLNAPSLFLIARDLSRMQVLVQVNEADIGQVTPGSPVTFTVDAFPGENFTGQVRKVRLNATMTQNVVTYTVEIVTDNASLKLLPYLTANVRFVVEKRENVITVPNAALRWSPASEAPTAAGAGQRSAQNSKDAAPGAEAPAAARGAAGGAPPQTQSQASDDSAPPARGSRGNRGPATIWLLREGKAVGIDVRAGLTDGIVTEVSSDELNEGDLVIVGEISAAAAAATNPFAPQIMRGGRGRR